MKIHDETHFRESTASGVGRWGPLLLFLLSSWHKISGGSDERHSQGSLSAGILGHLARTNVPLRPRIVGAVLEDSDAFSVWQTEAGRDGRTACSPAQIENWWQEVSTAGGTAMTNRSAHNPNAISSGLCVCGCAGYRSRLKRKSTWGSKKCGPVIQQHYLTQLDVIYSFQMVMSWKNPTQVHVSEAIHLHVPLLVLYIYNARMYRNWICLSVNSNLASCLPPVPMECPRSCIVVE